MPKIYEYFGLEFYIYRGDHTPVHVHVLHDNKETIFEFDHNVNISIRNNKRRNTKKALIKKDKEKAKRD
jgi:hypothetical protein